MRESHKGLDASAAYAQNELIAINLDTYEQQTLVTGTDFYSSPKLSSDGKSLCWLCWSHPHMPWDETALYCADFDEHGLLCDHEHIAGSGNESIFQPEWDNDNRLVFISDRSNWWNLYRCDPRGDVRQIEGLQIEGLQIEGLQIESLQIESLHNAAMEFGRPQWVFGQRTYSINSLNEIVCSYFQQGQWGLARLAALDLEQLGPAYSDLKSICCDGQQVWAIASTPELADHIISIDLNKVSPVNVASAGAQVTYPLPIKKHPLKAYFSEPRSIIFKSGDQGDLQDEVQGYLYLPCNKDYDKNDYGDSPNSLPPLIIKTHGGPSSAATSGLDLSIQYWTSRGFALFDINYRGSTGFGRSFRELLYGNWGVYDVEDCLFGARHLIEKKLVNPNQIIIRGHSAGGYTTLCALLFHDFFNAGASLYGISDLKKLADECHKFESHYVEKLIGSEQEFAQRYQDRSPLHAKQSPTCPIIFMQGLKDKVVPANQSQLMVNKLKQEGIPVAYIEFPEEGHGFQYRDNRIAALEAELYFYRKVFNFEDLEQLPKLDIANLEPDDKR